MPSDRLIFLIGFMGSGKSTLGRGLADALGWEFADTDAMVEEREGRSIDRIFSESGEGHFRRVEQEVLESFDGRERWVVATGGGLFLGFRQRSWMRSRGSTIWLDAPLQVCMQRVGKGDARPLWLPRDRTAFQAFFDKRRACYALAERRVDASRPDPSETLSELRAQLGSSFFH